MDATQSLVDPKPYFGKFNPRQMTPNDIVQLVLDSPYLSNLFPPFLQVSVLSRPPTYRVAQAGLDKGALSVAFATGAGEMCTPPPLRSAGSNDRSRGKALLAGDGDVGDDEDDGEVHVVAGDSTRWPRSVSVAARELVDVA